MTVGLPARGKTYLAHKLSRDFRWLGILTKIFSVGDYRRAHLGPKPHDWFNSVESQAERKWVANLVLEDLINWIKSGGQVITLILWLAVLNFEKTGWYL